MQYKEIKKNKNNEDVYVFERVTAVENEEYTQEELDYKKKVYKARLERGLAQADEAREVLAELDKALPINTKA